MPSGREVTGVCCVGEKTPYVDTALGWEKKAVAVAVAFDDASDATLDDWRFGFGRDGCEFALKFGPRTGPRASGGAS